MLTFNNINSKGKILQICIPLNVRLSWDPSTAQCHVINDMSAEQSENSPQDPRELSHIYYWEVNWPRFFSNRDYVCGRRCKIFKDDEGREEAFVIFSKSTQHTNCPKKTKAFRVENYWSVLTIKPFTSGKAFLVQKLAKCRLLFH